MLAIIMLQRVPWIAPVTLSRGTDVLIGSWKPSPISEKDWGFNARCDKTIMNKYEQIKLHMHNHAGTCPPSHVFMYSVVQQLPLLIAHVSTG